MNAITKTNNDQQVVTLWLAKRQGGPNTIRSYSATAQRFLAWCLERNVTLSTLNLEGLIEWRASLSGKDSTIGQRLAAIKSLLTFAHRIGYLQFNVGQAIEKPRIVKTRIKIITEQQVSDIIQCARSISTKAGLFLELLYYSGCRISEVFEITNENLELQPNGVTILNVIGKGNRSRSVVLPDSLARRLLKTERLFPWCLRKARDVVYQAATMANVPDVSPHTFRHACASHAISNGASIGTVKDHLGHISLATTSLYVHATEGAGSFLREM